jgi:hypothetical protein
VTRKMFEINSPRNQREVMAVEYEKHDSLRNIEWVDAKCITLVFGSLVYVHFPDQKRSN